MTHTLKRTLGCCYYPEHWPEDLWTQDAARMVDLGLTWVRIGEFAWSRIEPTPGKLTLDWLDRAIDVLGQAGLKVVLGTPTATPPRWMLTRHPDMLALDIQSHPRGFGSRRHYCFSHTGYRDEAARITRILAERYGANPHIAAWQTDNEYGCHDTVLSYSNAARTAFRDWLAVRYKSIFALNDAWGNIFWSMEYASFGDIDLPNLTVTEPNPAHVQAFRRFSSDQVVAFNRVQTDVLRAHTNAPVAHNYMGRVTEFDHYATGADLDIASWDSYPLGFLEDRVGASEGRQRAYAQQGDPDFQAFHHDLYRAVGGCAPGAGPTRWWVMEQQPGPVNWAPVNPAPLPGMVRLWTWEAFAHGAESVLYFRWRQAPFAQEQLHAGLLRPDSAPAQGFEEAAIVARELIDAPEVTPAQAPVALIFDYDAEWAWATQPQGAGLRYFDLVFEHYRALRRMGLSVDILAPETRDFSGYKAVLAPGMVFMPDDLKSALTGSQALVLVGPRSAARDGDFTIPVPLPPAWPGLDVAVSRLETIRADLPRALSLRGSVIHWQEALETTGDTVMSLEDGTPVVVEGGGTLYCGAWLDEAGLDRLIEAIGERAGLTLTPLPEGLRCRETGTERFWFNHATHDIESPDGPIPPAGVLRVPL